jgi:hypothetical protein
VQDAEKNHPHKDQVQRLIPIRRRGSGGDGWAGGEWWRLGRQVAAVVKPCVGGGLCVGGGDKVSMAYGRHSVTWGKILDMMGGLPCGAVVTMHVPEKIGLTTPCTYNDPL